MMLYFVIGGASSGKSAYAEDLVLSFGGTRYYLATMSSRGEHAQQRIERHLAMRAGKGFVTVEAGRGLSSVLNDIRQPESTVLVEDLGNLVARLLFDDEGTLQDPERAYEEVLADFAQLAQRCKRVVIVGNDVGADGVEYDEMTRSYVKTMGELSCKLAARSDVVVEVSAGCPQVVKGELLPERIVSVPLSNCEREAKTCS